MYTIKHLLITKQINKILFVTLLAIPPLCILLFSDLAHATDEQQPWIRLLVLGMHATEGSETSTAVFFFDTNSEILEGEHVDIPLIFTGGTVGVDFALKEHDPPGPHTGDTVGHDNVSIDGNTITFTGPLTSADTPTFFRLVALEDDDNENEHIDMRIPEDLGNGIRGFQGSDGAITIHDDESDPISATV